MVRSLQCTVSGKVQGVMFRAYVYDQATSLGLCGWVRNLADGKVEVLAQGSDDAVNELKKRLLAGSSLSRVDNVSCKWLDYDKEHKSFEIRS
jgi:acylphosphatase